MDIHKRLRNMEALADLMMHEIRSLKLDITTKPISQKNLIDTDLQREIAEMKRKAEIKRRSGR